MKTLFWLQECPSLKWPENIFFAGQYLQARGHQASGRFDTNPHDTKKEQQNYASDECGKCFLHWIWIGHSRRGGAACSINGWLSFFKGLRDILYRLSGAIACPRCWRRILAGPAINWSTRADEETTAAKGKEALRPNNQFRPDIQLKRSCCKKVYRAGGVLADRLLGLVLQPALLRPRLCRALTWWFGKCVSILRIGKFNYSWKHINTFARIARQSQNWKGESNYGPSSQKDWTCRSLWRREPSPWKSSLAAAASPSPWPSAAWHKHLIFEYKSCSTRVKCFKLSINEQ